MIVSYTDIYTASQTRYGDMEIWRGVLLALSGEPMAGWIISFGNITTPAMAMMMRPVADCAD